ncbi:MAG TPA: hypothetical protein IAA74_04670 [Candidatus Excrementavichristensenella intestinipullorum]|nr:hypothetical protein [Candidatus Excrementavichristensenella intestinipullorum]
MQHFLNGLLTITAAMWGSTGPMCVILLYVILLDRANEEPCLPPSGRRFFKGWCLACILSTGASIAALLLFNQP